MEHVSNEEKARVLSTKGCLGAYISKDIEAYATEEDKKRLSIYGACLEAMQWKDEQNKQENHLRYNIFRKNHQEYLDRDREETIEFVQDWLTDNTDINEWLIENLVEAMREANATKQRIERRKRE